jgi:hypothetical protein
LPPSGWGPSWAASCTAFFPSQARQKLRFGKARCLASASRRQHVDPCGPRPLQRPALFLDQAFAAAQFVAYAVVVLWINSEFGVAIVAYLPATMFLLVVLTLEHRGSPSPALAQGILGFVLTLVAAAIQALPVAIHPVSFDHNALYHFVQGLGLVSSTPARDGPPCGRTPPPHDLKTRILGVAN